jgi:hypothetical protein
LIRAKNPHAGCVERPAATGAKSTESLGGSQFVRFARFRRVARTEEEFLHDVMFAVCGRKIEHRAN